MLCLAVVPASVARDFWFGWQLTSSDTQDEDSQDADQLTAARSKTTTESEKVSEELTFDKFEIYIEKYVKYRISPQTSEKVTISMSSSSEPHPALFAEVFFWCCGIAAVGQLVLEMFHIATGMKDPVMALTKPPSTIKVVAKKVIRIIWLFDIPC